MIEHEYDSLSRCLGGEMVDKQDSKSRAKEHGGLSPLKNGGSSISFCSSGSPFQTDQEAAHLKNYDRDTMHWSEWP